jgi:hypothetical protein
MFYQISFMEITPEATLIKTVESQTLDYQALDQVATIQR